MKTKPLFVVLAVIIVAAVAVIAATARTGTNAPVPNPTGSETGSGTPQRISVAGAWECLPHKNTAGPQTLECALGIKGTDGKHYAVDTNLLQAYPVTFPAGTQVKAEGILTPANQLNSDTWQKYPIEGILSVTSISKVQSEPVPASASGIRGSVLLGPTCPVMRNPPDPQCADRPYAAKLALTTDQGTVVKEFSSNADGTFSVSAGPGTYAIRSADGASMLPRCSSNGAIEVSANNYASTTIYCDTGIR